MKEFRVGEKVRHFSGHIGKIVQIENNIVYIKYSDGQNSRCNLKGYALRKRKDGTDEQVVFKLTKLEKALR